MSKQRKYADEELKYFKEQAKKKGDSAKLSYSAPYRQQSRFNAVLDMLQPIGIKSCLDVGCGLGDFLPQLKARHPESLEKYVGIDIVDAFTEEATKRHYNMTGMKSVDFMQGSIFDLAPSKQWDAAIAIGMFTKATDNHHDLMKQTIQKMWKHTRKVMVFTTFSTITRDMPDENQAVSLNTLLSVVSMIGAEKFKLSRYDPAYVNVLAIYR